MKGHPAVAGCPFLFGQGHGIPCPYKDIRLIPYTFSFSLVPDQ